MCTGALEAQVYSACATMIPTEMVCARQCTYIPPAKGGTSQAYLKAIAIQRCRPYHIQSLTINGRIRVVHVDSSHNILHCLCTRQALVVPHRQPSGCSSSFIVRKTQS